MKQAAVLVVPSRVEAFGITILEGWRAGVPVVATSHGGPPEFMTDRVDGHLIDPLDSEALRAAIEETVAGGAAVEELARAGRQRVATLTWQAAAKSYERVYARVVGQTDSRHRGVESLLDVPGDLQRRRRRGGRRVDDVHLPGAVWTRSRRPSCRRAGAPARGRQRATA